MEFESIENVIVPRRHYQSSASYGAIRYLPQSRLNRHFEWIHGWRPTWFDAFPEEGLGDVNQNRLYGVADPSHQSLLRNYGADSWVVGLPFAYELFTHNEPIGRIPNSCIYLPPHATHEHECAVDTHIDLILDDLSRYDHVTICLHWASFRDLAIRESYQKHGWKVVEGANNNDVNSLKRMIYLFKQHYYLIADYYGSHIAYAAACGCDLHFVRENKSRLPLDCKGLTARSVTKWRELTCLDTIMGDIASHKSNRGSMLSWGLNQIGYQYVDFSKLQRVKHSGRRYISARLTTKVFGKLRAIVASNDSIDYRYKLADFAVQKTLFRQPIVVFDSVLANQLGKYQNPYSYIQKSTDKQCSCSNVTTCANMLPEDFGTVVMEYCNKCVQKVVNQIRKSPLHTKYLLYSCVQSPESVSQVIPSEMSATIFDFRVFQVYPDVSKPEVLFCVAYVVDKILL